VNDENSVANIQAKSFDVEEEIHHNLLKLARFQSLITRQLVYCFFLLSLEYWTRWF
jgi:hypothetical protein